MRTRESGLDGYDMMCSIENQKKITFLTSDFLELSQINLKSFNINPK